MMKPALLFSSAVLAVGISAAAVAEPYPDFFADYLNAHSLYFDYLAAAEESFWVKTSTGDIVLKMPRAVAPRVSVVSAEGQPPDADVAHIRSDVESAMSSALDRLGVRRCSTDATDDLTSCVPFSLQIGFSVRHGDVIYLPNLRDSRGRQIAGMAARYFGSQYGLYAMACGTSAETSTAGEATHLDAAFTLEIIRSAAPATDTNAAPVSNFLLPRQATLLTSAMERCLLGLLGVSVVPDLPEEDIGYYVARSLETLHKAATYLTHDQTADDIPQLVMTHALRKALGKEPTIGQ